MLPLAKGKVLDDLANFYSIKPRSTRKILWLFIIKESDKKFRKRINEYFYRFGTFRNEETTYLDPII
jgi:hypothetical protein